MARRGASEGSVYQVNTGPHAGKWRGAVVVGWKANGQPDRKTALRDTEQECRRALRDLLNKRDAGQLRTRAEDWTLADWLPHWLNVIRADDARIGASTRVDYESLIRIWLTPQIGKVRLHQVKEQHGLKLQEAMKAAGRSASRRHHAHVVLVSALDAAVPKLIGYNPLQHMDPPSVPHRRIKPPEREDVEAIYQVIVGHDLEARFLLALILGLRQGEALGLEWRHIDLDAATVTIEQQQRRTRGRHACGDPIPAPVDGKPDRMAYRCGFRYASKCPGGTPGTLAIQAVKTERGNRTLPLTDDLVKVLRALKKQQARDRLMHGEAYQAWTADAGGALRQVGPKEKVRRPIDLLFRRGDGRPLDSRQDWQAWYEILVAAGLASERADGTFEGGTRLHNARHAAAVGMLDSGVPLAHLADLMGHSSEAFSWSQYGYRSKEASDAARESLQNHHGKLRTRPGRRGTGTS
jgi:integrase